MGTQPHPFLICLLVLFFSQLFVRSPQTTILPCCISFSWGWYWSPSPVQCYKEEKRKDKLIPLFFLFTATVALPAQDET